MEEEQSSQSLGRLVPKKGAKLTCSNAQTVDEQKMAIFLVIKTYFENYIHENCGIDKMSIRGEEPVIYGPKTVIFSAVISGIFDFPPYVVKTISGNIFGFFVENIYMERKTIFYMATSNKFFCHRVSKFDRYTIITETGDVQRQVKFIPMILPENDVTDSKIEYTAKKYEYYCIDNENPFKTMKEADRINVDLSAQMFEDRTIFFTFHSTTKMNPSMKSTSLNMTGVRKRLQDEYNIFLRTLNSTTEKDEKRNAESCYLLQLNSGIYCSEDMIKYYEMKLQKFSGESKEIMKKLFLLDKLRSELEKKRDTVSTLRFSQFPLQIIMLCLEKAYEMKKDNSQSLLLKEERQSIVLTHNCYPDTWEYFDEFNAAEQFYNRVAINVIQKMIQESRKTLQEENPCDVAIRFIKKTILQKVIHKFLSRKRKSTHVESFFKSTTTDSSNGIVLDIELLKKMGDQNTGAMSKEDMFKAKKKIRTLTETREKIENARNEKVGTQRKEMRKASTFMRGLLPDFLMADINGEWAPDELFSLLQTPFTPAEVLRARTPEVLFIMTTLKEIINTYLPSMCGLPQEITPSYAIGHILTELRSFAAGVSSTRPEKPIKVDDPVDTIGNFLAEDEKTYSVRAIIYPIYSHILEVQKAFPTSVTGQRIDTLVYYKEDANREELGISILAALEENGYDDENNRIEFIDGSMEEGVRLFTQSNPLPSNTSIAQLIIKSSRLNAANICRSLNRIDDIVAAHSSIANIKIKFNTDKITKDEIYTIASRHGMAIFGQVKKIQLSCISRVDEINKTRNNYSTIVRSVDILRALYQICCTSTNDTRKECSTLIEERKIFNFAKYIPNFESDEPEDVLGRIATLARMLSHSILGIPIGLFAKNNLRLKQNSGYKFYYKTNSHGKTDTNNDVDKMIKNVKYAIFMDYGCWCSMERFMLLKNLAQHMIETNARVPVIAFNSVKIEGMCTHELVYTCCKVTGIVISSDSRFRITYNLDGTRSICENNAIENKRMITNVEPSRLERWRDRARSCLKNIFDKASNEGIVNKIEEQVFLNSGDGDNYANTIRIVLKYIKKDKKVISGEMSPDACVKTALQIERWRERARGCLRTIFDKVSEVVNEDIIIEVEEEVFQNCGSDYPKVITKVLKYVKRDSNAAKIISSEIEPKTAVSDALH